MVIKTFKIFGRPLIKMQWLKWLKHKADSKVLIYCTSTVPSYFAIIHE